MEKAERSSNFELLKIVAMFCICLSHVVNPLLPGSGFFPNFSYDPLALLFSFIKNLGWVGDYIFIICSAYFLAGSKKFKWRKMILYYVEIALLFMLYYAVAAIFKLGTTEGLTLKVFTTGIIFDYWFIYSYIIFIAFVPLLTWICNKLPQKVHKIITYCTLLILMILCVLTWFGHGGTLVGASIFACAFFIMDYGKKYGEFLWMKEDDKKTSLITILVCILAYFFFTWVVNVISIYHPFFIENERETMDIYFPTHIMFGIAVFLLVKNMKIKHSNVINYISSLSLIFYIAHHNKLISPVFQRWLSKSFAAQTNPFMCILVFLCFGLFRFIFGLVVAAVYHETVHRGLSALVSIGEKKQSKPKTIKN